jgi:hypothetical protein
MMGPYYGYLACPGCGVAVQRSELDRDVHRCVPERFVSHQARQARPGLERLEEDLASWTGQRARAVSGSRSSVS